MDSDSGLTFDLEIRQKKKIFVVGSGAWASTIAKIIATNIEGSERYDEEVTMYVSPYERVEGRKLKDIINETRENIKDLPGFNLPDNVVAVDDFDGARMADVLIFVCLKRLIREVCLMLKGKIKPSAVGLCLIKGFHVEQRGRVQLLSEFISQQLDIEVSVLSGANIAEQVANEYFCETTIGCKNKELWPVLTELFETRYFRVYIVEDALTVELCGALKNIVSVAAGFIDGLKLGDNTKAAVIRLGLMEMIRFAQVFYPDSRLETFYENCGIADLLSTCFTGRTRRVAEEHVNTGRPFYDLEKEMLISRMHSEPFMADEVYTMLKQRNIQERFPVFDAVRRVYSGDLPVDKLVDAIRIHPEHKIKIQGYVEGETDDPVNNSN